MSPTPPSAPEAALLEAADLCAERGGRRLWRGLNLQLHAGDCRWLRGANGCGKTTLLRTLAGLRAPSAGRVTRGTLRYLGHAQALSAELSVSESLRFSASLQGLSASEPLRPALERLGLLREAARPVRQLSQGQRRRAALAALALPQPAGTVWLLDEPFDALDDDGVRRLQGLLDAHARSGGAVLFTSHQEAAALVVCRGDELRLSA
ncbi:heme ABC exporter ATP-binding protein CcmA [Roseateles sp. LKC17W]|uniref:Heme ABC exporter ATP-binding protein CcmA n=1 Tax=Pelomonas margarita TaxID=3299031 RepID=A0ABW7FN69_9BURK